MTRARYLADFKQDDGTGYATKYATGFSPQFSGTPTGISAAHITTGELPVGVTGGSGLTGPLQKSGGTMTGDISTTGTVDGRDVSADGAVMDTGGDESDLWTKKDLTTSLLINGTVTISQFSYTYTRNTSHALFICGGITGVGASGGTFTMHVAIYVDSIMVFMPDVHDIPAPWFHQGWAFMTPTLSSGSHTIHVTGLNQSGNWTCTPHAAGAYSQIVYRIIPL